MIIDKLDVLWSKKRVRGWICVLETLGFVLAILTCWITELFDPPFSVLQVVIDTAVIGLLGGLTVYSTWTIVKRLRYLEGFLLICVNCKKVQVDGEWVPFEALLGRDERLKLSQGVCPECTEVHYSAYRL